MSAAPSLPNSLRGATIDLSASSDEEVIDLSSDDDYEVIDLSSDVSSDDVEAGNSSSSSSVVVSSPTRRHRVRVPIKPNMRHQLHSAHMVCCHHLKH